MKSTAQQNLLALFLAWRNQGWKGDYFPELGQVPKEHLPFLMDLLTVRGLEPPQVTAAMAAIAAAQVTIVTVKATPHRFAEAVADSIGVALDVSVTAKREELLAQFARKTAKIRKLTDRVAAEAQIKEATEEHYRRLAKLDSEGHHERLVFLLPTDIAVHHFQQNLISENWGNGSIFYRFKSYWEFDIDNTPAVATSTTRKEADIVVFPYAPDLWELANCVRQLRPGSTVFINNALPPMTGTFPAYANQGSPRQEFAAVVTALAALPEIRAGSCVQEQITNLNLQLMPFAGRIVCDTRSMADSIAKAIAHAKRGSKFGFEKGDPVVLVWKDPSILHHHNAGLQGDFVSTEGEFSRVRFGKSTIRLPLRKCTIAFSHALFREWAVGQPAGPGEWAVINDPALAGTLTALGFNVRHFR